MALDIFKERGTPLDKQQFDWKELVQTPYSKLDDDAFTRVRVILMNGIEAEAIRFKHMCARFNEPLQLPLARIRRQGWAHDKGENGVSILAFAAPVVDRNDKVRGCETVRRP